MQTFDTIVAAVEAEGLASRGAFHVAADDTVPPFTDDAPAATLVLVGNEGPGMWAAFSTSEEAADGAQDALDRWSRRVVSRLADSLGGAAHFPFGGPPWLPFIRWAQRAGPVHPSPIGPLVHPDFGLWHAYRGAIAFRERLDLPSRDDRASPCEPAPIARASRRVRLARSPRRATTLRMRCAHRGSKPARNASARGASPATRARSAGMPCTPRRRPRSTCGRFSTRETARDERTCEIRDSFGRSSLATGGRSARGQAPLVNAVRRRLSARQP